MIEDIISKYNVNYCMECGKCSGICPVTKAESQFSPRSLVEHALIEEEEDVITNNEIWSCLACKACTDLCPSNVDFLGFIRSIRNYARQRGYSGISAHTGVFQAITQNMRDDQLIQSRIDWISDGLKTKTEGSDLLFVGCQPYFDIIFSELGYQGLEGTTKNAIRILNHLGIEPVIMPNERCCGHDAFWTGDFDTFEDLAKLNLEAIEKSGAKRIITTCPECCQILKQEYPNVKDLGLEVVHITELLADELKNEKLKLNPLANKVTFQDPCRLGRHLDVVNEPRAVLNAIPELELIELENHGKQSVCCGTTCWSNCDNVSETIRKDRLLEVMNLNMKTLVTACPKCQIHFRCVLTTNPDKREVDGEIQVIDIVELFSQALADGKKKKSKAGKKVKKTKGVSE